MYGRDSTVEFRVCVKVVQLDNLEYPCVPELWCALWSLCDCAVQLVCSRACVSVCSSACV